MLKCVRPASGLPFGQSYGQAVEIVRDLDLAAQAGLRATRDRRGAEWLHDRFVDHAVYGVIASDWKA